MRNRVLFCALACWSVVVTNAQNTTEKVDSTDLSKYNLNRVWEQNVLLDAEVDTLPQRLFEEIVISKEKVEVEPQSYDSKSFSLQLPQVKPNLKVYPVKDEKSIMPYGNLINVGFGNYTTPYFELFATTRKLMPYRLGTHLKHFSSSTGPVDKKNSAQSLNSASVFGDYFHKSWVFNAALDYKRLGHNYYGYNDTLVDVDRDTIGINYNIFHVKLGGTFRDTIHKLQGGMFVEFFSTHNNFEAAENDLVFGFRPSYSLKEHQRIVLDIDGSILSYSDTVKANRTWLSFSPSYVSKGDKLNFDVGFNITSENDTLSNKSFHFYPRIQANYLLEKPHGVRAYAGVTGKSNRNNLRNIISEMPYLKQQSYINNTNVGFEFFAGIKGTMLGKLTIDLKAQYDVVDNYMMFINDSISQELLTIQYAAGNIFKVENEIMYHGVKNLDLSLNTIYAKYSFDDYSKAIHLPALDVSLYAAYKIKDKVRLIADFYYLSSLYSYNFVQGEASQMDNIVDLNLHGEYYFNKKMSAFLQLNNLLTKKYERYLHYKTKGLSVLAGVSYSF